MTLWVGLSHCFVVCARRRTTRNDTFLLVCSIAYAAAYDTDFADDTDSGRTGSIQPVKSV